MKDLKIANDPTIHPPERTLRLVIAIARAQVEADNVSGNLVALPAGIETTHEKRKVDMSRLTVVEDQGSTAPVRIVPTRRLASPDIEAQAAGRNELLGKECIGEDQDNCIW